MAALVDLPTELLLAIFHSCEITDSIHLSATCHRLHQIWLEQSEDIVGSVIGALIDDFNGAKQLAVIEARLLPPTATDALTPPVHLWLPRLLENWTLASKLDDAFRADRHMTKARLPRVELFASYHMLRRLKLAYTYQELRPGLYQELYEASSEKLEYLWLLQYFMGTPVGGLQDKELHGMIYDWKLYDVDCINGEDGDPWLTRDWYFALEAVAEVYYESDTE